MRQAGHGTVSAWALVRGIHVEATVETINEQNAWWWFCPLLGASRETLERSGFRVAACPDGIPAVPGAGDALEDARPDECGRGSG